MILHQIEALVAVGVNEVVLAVNYKPEKMNEFLCKKEKELGIKITTSLENEPLGTAGPIKLAEQSLNDGEPFFVLNSDVSCEYPFEDMIAFQKDTGAGGVLLATPVEDPSKFGVILYDDQGKIESFVEKPKQFISRFINAGIYYLTPAIFDRIELRPTSIEKEVFPAMADEGLLYVMELKGFWADVGQPKDYLAGQTMRLTAYAREEPEKLVKGEKMIGNVLIDVTAKVHPNAVLGPDVVVGPDCIIGDGARIKDTTLLKGCKIGAHSYVSKSIIGWHSKIGSWVRIENNSVLGEDVTVGDEFHVNECVVLPHKAVKKNLPTATIIL